VRELSRQFLNDLKDLNGVLWPILDRVKHDHTLMLAIRDGYINIYYRGGNLLRVKARRPGGYRTFFDKKYNKGRGSLPECPAIVLTRADAEEWVKSFPHYKQAMDCYFSAHSKPEREFQQLTARENNFSSISNESEYFILDIEFAEPGFRDGGRFDMLAMRWLACDRRDGSCCRPALIEMKYADGALDGSAGLVKHLEDIDRLVSDIDRYSRLVRSMERRFEQLDELGLLDFHRAKGGIRVKLDIEEGPEVIIILANHNPRSTKLATILDDPRLYQYSKSSRFELRFHVTSFAGYGMHKASILSLVQFRQLLKTG